MKPYMLTLKQLGLEPTDIRHLIALSDKLKEMQIWADEQCQGTVFVSSMFVTFADKRDAMLFKLTWAGTLDKD